MLLFARSKNRTRRAGLFGSMIGAGVRLRDNTWSQSWYSGREICSDEIWVSGCLPVYEPSTVVLEREVPKWREREEGSHRKRRFNTLLVCWRLASKVTGAWSSTPTIWPIWKMATPLKINFVFLFSYFHIILVFIYFIFEIIFLCFNV